MSTRVAYGSAGTGQEVQDFVGALLAVVSKGRRLMGKLNSASSGADWTGLETEVGGMVPGTGQTLWTILSTAQAQIDVSQVAELARLDKGF